MVEAAASVQTCMLKHKASADGGREGPQPWAGSPAELTLSKLCLFGLDIVGPRGGAETSLRIHCAPPTGDVMNRLSSGESSRSCTAVLSIRRWLQLNCDTPAGDENKTFFKLAPSESGGTGEPPILLSLNTGSSGVAHV